MASANKINVLGVFKRIYRDEYQWWVSQFSNSFKINPMKYSENRIQNSNLNSNLKNCFSIENYIFAINTRIVTSCMNLFIYSFYLGRS